jgi:hypothetical protein
MLTIILATFVFILVGLVVIELTTRKSQHKVYDTPFIKAKVSCQPGKVTCRDDVDCLQCSEKLKENLTCQKVSSALPERRCLSGKPVEPCNEKLGGVWVWSGTGWFCSCTYPEIAGGKGCQKVNPNVCQGGRYTFDARKGQPPSLTDCQCRKGSFRFLNSRFIPVCVTPDKSSPCYSKGSCAHLYSLWDGGPKASRLPKGRKSFEV